MLDSLMMLHNTSGYLIWPIPDEHGEPTGVHEIERIQIFFHPEVERMLEMLDQAEFGQEIAAARRELQRMTEEYQDRQRSHRERAAELAALRGEQQ